MLTSRLGFRPAHTFLLCGIRHHRIASHHINKYRNPTWSCENLAGVTVFCWCQTEFRWSNNVVLFWSDDRFDSWLSSRLKLPPNYLTCYSGNYTDDSKSWRPVEISRLTTKYQHDQADKRICTSLVHSKSCSIEQALWKTERFQKWLKAKRLTPDLVQVCKLIPEMFESKEHSYLEARCWKFNVYSWFLVWKFDSPLHTNPGTGSHVVTLVAYQNLI